MRRPIDCGVVGVPLLIAAAAPALRLAPTFPDNAAIPAGFESRQVADTVDREFIRNLMYPVIISLESGRPGQARVSPALFAASLARTPGVELVSPIAPPSQGVVPLEAVLSHPPYAAASQAVVAAVRALHFPLGVGGNAADEPGSDAGLTPCATLLIGLEGAASAAVAPAASTAASAALTSPTRTNEAIPKSRDTASPPSRPTEPGAPAGNITVSRCAASHRPTSGPGRNEPGRARQPGATP
jgi:hypothetical protein